MALAASPKGSRLVSPGCRGSKVKVARIYMGSSHGLWPKPKLNFREEIRRYESEFAKLKDELSDVDFVVDELVTTTEQAARVKERLKGVEARINDRIYSIDADLASRGGPRKVDALEMFASFLHPELFK